MSTLLLVNPAAGNGRAARLANETAAAAREAWGEVVVMETRAPGHGTEQVRDAVRQGARRVLVLGGDGTLHEAANGVLSSAVAELPPIGIVAGGTGNDYAKIAGTVGLAPTVAVDRLARGRIRYLDVGVVWGEYFLNAIGIGFDAEVARYMNANSHARGLAGYLGAVFKVMRIFRPFRAEVVAEGTTFTERLLLLEVGIGNVVGGGFRLTPDAQPDDGLFDVCAIRGVSIPGLLLRLPLTIPGWHTRLPDVRSFRTPTMTVIGLDGPLVAQLDGEVRSREGRMEIRIEPRAPAGHGDPVSPLRHFSSDNNAGAHPEVLRAIAEANTGHVPSYGGDPYTAAAEAAFRAAFGEGTSAFLVWNGTAANVLGLQAVTRPFQAVICAAGAHIDVDECAAPERFTGCKLLPVPTTDGKLGPDDLEPLLLSRGDEHRVQPRVLSITQATELGTVYRPDELRALTDAAHASELLVHMDGARICNAAASLGLSFREITTDVGVDLVSFGGTKVGLLGAEAVLFLNGLEIPEFKYLRKQGTHLASKMRFLAVQFEVLLRDELWRRSASHANAMARRLAEQLWGLDRVRLTQPVEANGVFAVIPPETVAPLQARRRFQVWNPATSEVRWMTAWDTTEEDVDTFAEDIREVVG